MDEKEAVALNAQECRYQYTWDRERFVGELVSTKEYHPSKEELLKILDIFWETPYDAVRKVCVEKVKIFMRHDSYHTVDISDETALWFEERIPLIVNSEFHTIHIFWEQLLSG